MWIAALLALTLPGGRGALASCDTIPGTVQRFRGALGSVDRPFAAPGITYVQVRLQPSVCDGASTGFIATKVDAYAVTLLFKSPTGERNAVVLATNCKPLEKAVEACSASGVQTTCIPANPPGASPGLALLSRDQDVVLSFRFPATDDASASSATAAA